MLGKRNFDDFSPGEIADIASEAASRARKQSLEAGLEILSQDLETGEFFSEMLGREGNVVKRTLTRDEVAVLKNN